MLDKELKGVCGIFEQMISDHIVLINIRVTVFHYPIYCRLYVSKFSTCNCLVHRIGLLNILLFVHFVAIR